MIIGEFFKSALDFPRAFFKNKKVLIGIALAVVLIIGVSIFLLSKNKEKCLKCGLLTL